MAYNAGPIDFAEEYDRHSTIALLCNLLIVIIAFTYLSNIDWHIRIPDLAGKYSIG